MEFFIPVHDLAAVLFQCCAALQVLIVGLYFIVILLPIIDIILIILIILIIFIILIIRIIFIIFIIILCILFILDININSNILALIWYSPSTQYYTAITITAIQFIITIIHIFTIIIILISWMWCNIEIKSLIIPIP